ncbi:DUF6390 family protein [Dactylosporangium sp. NPDC005572]|uniref:DUF6390 family protein n=1 Tax=Dactylosporangium sp. NPDC005572 TaxID=3156889 RepID=UPI0033A45D12
MSREGERLFARYAFSPNDLGYCGPADASALFELAVTGHTDGDVVAIARRFSGAWPYLVLLAELTGGTDPLDETLVRAYWTGAPAEGVEAAEFGARLLNRLGARAGHYWHHLDGALLPEAAPDHGFHVFGVYPWSRMLPAGPPEQPLHVLDSCRISWGQVTQVRDGDGQVVVRRRPLGWDGERLGLLPEREHEVRYRIDGRGFVTDPRPGEWLALHWDWACDRLTDDDLTRLRQSTADRLALTNERLATGTGPRRAAAAAPPR